MCVSGVRACVRAYVREIARKYLMLNCNVTVYTV